jgi:hypothetical protein
VRLDRIVSWFDLDKGVGRKIILRQPRFISLDHIAHSHTGWHSHSLNTAVCISCLKFCTFISVRNVIVTGVRAKNKTPKQ